MNAAQSAAKTIVRTISSRATGATNGRSASSGTAASARRGLAAARNKRIMLTDRGGVGCSVEILAAAS
jgi:hypothetical protein